MKSIREQIGSSVFIEQKGPNWRIVDGAGLVCVVRGRSQALEMATRHQRHQDEKLIHNTPAPVPAPAPAPTPVPSVKIGGVAPPQTKPGSYPRYTDESGIRYHVQEPKTNSPTQRQSQKPGQTRTASLSRPNMRTPEERRNPE